MGHADPTESVFDILNCGPRNRFATPNLIVHNCLGLGFACGWEKFVSFSRKSFLAIPGGDALYAEVFGAPVTAEQVNDFWYYVNEYTKSEQKKKLLRLKWDTMDTLGRRSWVNSWLQVMAFRKANPKLASNDKGNPGLWAALDRDFKASLGSDFQMELPSGRVLNYFNVCQDEKGQYMASTTLGDKPKYLYGGLLTENCLAGDTEVLTFDRGWVPLSTVQPDDLLHDGQYWVRHDGLVCRGEQPVVELQGVTCTPDHEFLHNGQWVSAAKLLSYEQQVIQTPWAPTEATGETVRHTDSNGAGPDGGAEDRVGSPMRLRELHKGCRERASSEVNMQPPVSALPESAKRSTDFTRDDLAPHLRRMEVDEATVHGIHPRSLAQLRRAWDSCVRRLVKLLRSLQGRHVTDLERRAGPGSPGQQRGLLSRELSMGGSKNKLPQSSRERGTWLGAGPGGSQRHPTLDAVLPDSARGAFGDGMRCTPRQHAVVYDILNCGPGHRFSVRAPGGRGPVLIAHNCVQATARDVLGEALVRIWRSGIKIVLHVHDEIVCEVPLSFDSPIIERLMVQTPTWAKSLPIGVELIETPVYVK